MKLTGSDLVAGVILQSRHTQQEDVRFLRRVTMRGGVRFLVEGVTSRRQRTISRDTLFTSYHTKEKGE